LIVGRVERKYLGITLCKLSWTARAEYMFQGDIFFAQKVNLAIQKLQNTGANLIKRSAPFKLARIQMAFMKNKVEIDV
jgi:hypothetical protein